MRSSSELGDASAVLFQQSNQLGIHTIRTAVGIFDDPNEAMELWLTSYDDSGEMTKIHYYFNLHIHSVFENIIPARQEGKLYALTVLSGNDVRLYYQTMATYLSVPRQQVFNETEYFYSFFFSGGTINAVTNQPITEEQRKIMIRFAQVFGLIYTRFLDLQKAETNARDAQIESALERVRARAQAMQQPEELKDITQVFRHEMGMLGVEELETCSIYIYDESDRESKCWFALKDPRTAGSKLVSGEFEFDLNVTWVGREMLQFYHSKAKETSIVMTDESRKEWIHYCETRGQPSRGYYSEEIPDNTYHLYKFSNGAIGQSSENVISQGSWDLLKRAASVFSLAYSRFKDLTQARIALQSLKEEKSRAENALTELKATQRQLIQSEKMASLGELTADIAHEIQNPLNFINNFSEVNTELLTELKQKAQAGNTDNIPTLIEDIEKNQCKITHHGRRANSIVEGMLQHARISTGKREPVDLNKLVNEYLCLSYQGLRAKDKGFNAILQTHFDESIGEIQAIPQDIGRVLLNLYNNAFYAVNEKKARLSGTFEPTVSVRTMKEGNNVLITVTDNGTGMSQQTMNKAFQPFFTTKPTGEGTGLGLSLSYDTIAKGYGGNLSVKSREGEGSEFVVQLPAI
ncbi:GHKL domain-containing protein [Pontibacter diazotrophicus]|uniref:histidine kinase n=2 Tax=Pontibacter diazotrophicus TaxID=1400979 RepID=A0A3D8L2E4_9BACT|nr:GHKL domain-containing protein [Pontibacter diazotrophicus]